jgi:hypothetical protein
VLSTYELVVDARIMTFFTDSLFRACVFIDLSRGSLICDRYLLPLLDRRIVRMVCINFIILSCTKKF